MLRSSVVVPLATALAVTIAVVVAVVAADEDGDLATYDGSCASGASMSSTVTGLDATTGRTLWSRRLPHPREDAPRVRQDLALLVGCGALVLGSGTGRRVHRTPDEEGLLGLAGEYLVREVDDVMLADPVRGGTGGLQVSSEPPLTDVDVAGDLALAVSGSRLEAHDLAAPLAAARWEVDLPGLGGDNDVLAAGAALLVRAADGSLYRLDASTGEVSWRVLPDRELLGPAAPALGFDRLLAADPSTAVVAVDDEHVVGLDLSDGRQRWVTAAPLSAGTADRWAVVGGVVVSAGDGVVGLDARTGRRLWQLAVQASRPVAAGDTVVLDDELSAVGVEPRTGDVLWRRATSHRPLVGSDPEGESVVVLDSPSVPHGMNDCC